MSTAICRGRDLDHAFSACQGGTWAPDPPIPALLDVGPLRFNLADRPRRCGIHGDDTTSGRCATCDTPPTTTA
mgnify:CR=1 FL=1